MRRLLLAALVWTFARTPAQAFANEDTCHAIPASDDAMRLVYVKSEHALCLFEHGAVVWLGSASHGRESGRKQYEGDRRTPEGRYTIFPARKSKRFGLFLRISYPNEEDKRAARLARKHAGQDVGIHGPQRWYAFLGAAQSLIDHSDGCIVVDDTGISELTSRIRKPMRLDILPTL